MLPNDILMLVSQLVSPVAMILGLWIAASWLPDVDAWLSSVGARSIASSRVGRLLVWVALGVLFGNPLDDLVETLTVSVRLWLGPEANVGSISTVWGHGSWAVYGEITALMAVVVYLLVLWAGYRVWPARVNEAGETRSLALQEWFVLLAAASLVNRFVDSIILRIIWLPVPDYIDMGRLSAVGLVGAWLLGLAILATILLVLLNSLRRSQPAG